jgi:hypothetical protein
MTETQKPKWEWRLPEAKFRALTARPIVEIKHGWKFTSEDTAENWITLKTDDQDKSKGETIKVESHMQSALMELFEFKPDHAELLRLTYRGEAARRRLQEIDAFEKSDHRERREYERLKKKFGNTSAP